MKINGSKVIVVGVLIALVVLFFVFDLQQYLTLDHIKSQQKVLDTYYQNHTAATIAVYMLIYIAVTALSLPGAAVMTLAGGWFFGLLTGTLVYVNAGTQLSKIDSLSGILSPGLLISFILLGIFPIVAKKGIKLIKRRTA